MWEFIERARQRPSRERHMIALIISGAIATLIFVIWATTFITRVSPEVPGQAVDTMGDVTLLESLKRKAYLLFGDTGIFERLGEPIEYKKEETGAVLLEEEDTNMVATTSTSTDVADYMDIIKEDEMNEESENR